MSYHTFLRHLDPKTIVRNVHQSILRVTIFARRHRDWQAGRIHEHLRRVLIAQFFPRIFRLIPSSSSGFVFAIPTRASRSVDAHHLTYDEDHPFIGSRHLYTVFPPLHNRFAQSRGNEETLTIFEVISTQLTPCRHSSVGESNLGIHLGVINQAQRPRHFVGAIFNYRQRLDYLILQIFPIEVVIGIHHPVTRYTRFGDTFAQSRTHHAFFRFREKEFNLFCHLVCHNFFCCHSLSPFAVACYLVWRIPYTPNKKAFLVACILANKKKLSTKKVKKKDLPTCNDIIGKSRSRLHPWMSWMEARDRDYLLSTLSTE